MGFFFYILPLLFTGREEGGGGREKNVSGVPVRERVGEGVVVGGGGGCGGGGGRGGGIWLEKCRKVSTIL